MIDTSVEKNDDALVQMVEGSAAPPTALYATACSPGASCPVNPERISKWYSASMWIVFPCRWRRVRYGGGDGLLVLASPRSLGD
jgi:hypothetical protein